MSAINNNPDVVTAVVRETFRPPEEVPRTRREQAATEQERVERPPERPAFETPAAEPPRENPATERIENLAEAATRMMPGEPDLIRLGSRVNPRSIPLGVRRIVTRNPQILVMGRNEEVIHDLDLSPAETPESQSVAPRLARPDNTPGREGRIIDILA